MTDLENPDAVAFLQRILERMGVTAALERAGVVTDRDRARDGFG